VLSDELAGQGVPTAVGTWSGRSDERVNENGTDSASATLAAYCRITFDNPPLNVMGPALVTELRAIMTALEGDEAVKVAVFDSAVDGFFLNHSDFLADFADLKKPLPTASRQRRRAPRFR